MKLTVNDVLTCLMILAGDTERSGLASQRIPVKAALPLRSTFKSLRDVWDTLMETQKEIAGREDGPEKDAAFTEFGNSEVEVAMTPVPVKDLGDKVEITPNEIGYLIAKGILKD